MKTEGDGFRSTQEVSIGSPQQPLGLLNCILSWGWFRQRKVTSGPLRNLNCIERVWKPAWGRNAGLRGSTEALDQADAGPNFGSKVSSAFHLQSCSSFSRSQNLPGSPVFEFSLACLPVSNPWINTTIWDSQHLFWMPLLNSVNTGQINTSSTHTYTGQILWKEIW